MKLSSSIALRPAISFVALGFLVLLIPISAILSHKILASRVEHSVQFACNYLRKHVFSEVQIIAGSLIPVNSSTMNLARVLRSSLNETGQLSFSTISTMVAPKLFLAFSMLPLLEISYIQQNGLFFSYYIEENQTLAVYSNTSFGKETTNASTSYWYTQKVDSNTGKPYGEVIVSKPSIFFTKSNWFQEAMNNSNGYSFVGSTGWGKIAEYMFISMASINNGGVVSLGISIKDFVNAIHGVDTVGGTLFLATDDGNILARTGTLNASMIVNNNSVSLEFVKNDGGLTSEITETISCEPSDNLLRDNDIMIFGEKHNFYCAPLELAGIHSVSVLVFRKSGLLRLIHKNDYLSSWLLALAVISVFLSTVFFIVLICRGARREMILCATLIKQMETTQQAERRSMNKSLAFANASHDIRGSISAIIGLIDICLSEVPHSSNTGNNLSLMKASSEDLHELLNCVLDSSKIEAGKMYLHEVDFNLAQVIEEAVNFVYPRAVEKGIDVVWDPCDGSVIKTNLVKGDQGKLKQILNNLLSNAVKFTSEGHIILRAWVRKPSPSLETSILASKNNGIWKCISQFLYKHNEEDYSNALHNVQQNEDALELVFEVDDTGMGIPKEKRNSVFENFVQVKETALGQGGTGLGLGIVQSLVRLMGGEISIVDKEIGERGTCFSFNIFLSKGDNSPSITVGEDSLVCGPLILNDQLPQQSGLSSRIQSPRLEGSHVILMIQGDERRKITENYMQSLGIKVSALNQPEHLLPILEKIKREFYLDHLSYSGKSEFGLYADNMSNSASNNSNAGTRDAHLSSNEGVDHISTPHRRTGSRSATSSFILIVIDDSVEPTSEVCSMVSNFSKKLPGSRCKVVGLVSSFITKDETRISRKRLIDSCDHIVIKPFHGSRLYQVLKLLPEYGGTFEGSSSKPLVQDAEPLTDNLSSRDVQNDIIRSCAEISSQQQDSPRFQQVANEGNNSSNDKPLTGKKVLLVEDGPVLRMLAIRILSRLGATIESCEDGEEAVRQVCESLQGTDQRIHGDSKLPPYDYILMDCMMPIMDGYEATRQIRKEEQAYNIHIPIIALTGNASAEEAEISLQSGMDFHLTKPLKEEELLNAIQFVDGKAKK